MIFLKNFWTLKINLNFYKIIFFKVEWVKLLLFFKKIRLFASFIKALKILYKINDFVHIFEKRIVKIIKW